MNKNRLWIAVILLLGLSGAAAFAMRSRTAETTVERPSAALPAIKKDEITSVEIENPKKGNVTLAKVDGSWRITAPLSAKPDQSSVDAVLDKLGELEVSQVAATRKENHARLEVDAAQAIRVKVKQGDKQVADLYLGASKGGGTMVRTDGQDTVVSVKGSFRYLFDKELKNFRDREILDIDAKEFTGLSLSSAKGKFVFGKPPAAEGAEPSESSESKWTQVLAKGEKPIQRFSESKVQSLASTLGHLRAVDFAAPDATAESLGLTTPSATAVLTKRDGTQLTLELGSAGGTSDEYTLRVSGDEVIYRISKYNADRLMADATAFEEPEKKAEAPAEPAPMPDMGGGGQIPPEVLRQLQQQLGGHGGMGGLGPH